MKYTKPYYDSIESAFGVASIEDADCVIVHYTLSPSDMDRQDVYASVDLDNPPQEDICVAKSCLERFVRESGYSSVEEFLQEYTSEDTGDLPMVAEESGELLFVYCEALDRLYVPENEEIAGVLKILANYFYFRSLKIK